MTMRRWMWPLLILATGAVLVGITTVQNWGIGCILLILLTLFGVSMYSLVCCSRTSSSNWRMES